MKITIRDISIRTEEPWIIVKLYDTDTVSFTDDIIVLKNVDPNGKEWKTVATKNCMNETAKMFNLKFSVFQQNFIWYVNHEGRVYEFKNKTNLGRRQYGT